jgi:hypothetical protein
MARIVLSMSHPARWLLLAFLSASMLPVLAQAAASSSSQAATTGQTSEKDTPDASYQAAEEEPPEGELAPAAIQLDVSQASPLIQELYAATRETKEQPTLARLVQAKS